MKVKWKNQLNQALSSGSHFSVGPNKTVGGFMLPREDWVSLNRFGTNVGVIFESVGVSWQDGNIINYASRNL